MSKIDFEIKAPKWAGVFSWCLTVIGALCMLAGAVLMIPAIPAALGLKLGLLIGGAAGVVFGALLLHIYYKEKFTLKNGLFCYVKPFRKSQSANVSEINHVTLHTSGIMTHVRFYDEKGNVLISFLDDGTSFRSGEFINALSAFKIPIYAHNEAQDLLP